MSWQDYRNLLETKNPDPADFHDTLRRRPDGV